MKEPIIELTSDALLTEVSRKKAGGWRLVTLTCAPLVPATEDGAIELFYHFDKELTLSHLKLRTQRGASVPSISPLYFAAFLVENEIQDQFGLTFEGLVLNYERTLLLEESSRDMASPFFRAAVVKKPKAEQPSAAPAEA